MWKLTPFEAGGDSYYLLPGQEYVVGRKSCDIILPNDQSISRAHAHLAVSNQALVLKDTSKYGTFVNEERLSGDTPRSLLSGDRLTFGVFQSRFRVDKEVLVVCSSCLENEGKAALSQALAPLGGRLANTWTQDCTHLVMPSVKVTIKTICALLCCRPIVKQEFFTEFSKALKLKRPPPKAESFYPAIDEPSLKEAVDLSARSERKHLFSGKTFLFLNAKQLKRLSSAVAFGGGQSQLLEEGSLPVPLLESPHSCVVDVAAGSSQALLPTSTQQWVHSVGRLLRRKGLRFISESEIGLAGIYISKDRYCNPANQLDSQPESVKSKTMTYSATLSQNATVNETVLQAGSQNVTAYVMNTEVNDRTVPSGVNTVAETPEKEQSMVKRRNLPDTYTVAETLMSSRSAPDRGDHTGTKKPGALTSRLPPPGTTESPKTSPQKQSSLISFFQPMAKKRSREESATADQSEAKHSRQDEGEKSESQRTPDSRTPLRKEPTLPSYIQTPTVTHPATQQSRGQAPLLPSEGHSCELHQKVGSRKRKERTLEGPAADGDSALEMEELESIMSGEMDEFEFKQQSPAIKKTRSDPEEHTRAKKPSLQSEEHGSDHRKGRRGPLGEQSSANTPTLDPEEGTSRRINQSCEPLVKIKQEGVSFVEVSKPQNGKDKSRPDLEDPCRNIPERTESKNSILPSGGKGEQDLPSKLLVVEFKSLMVTTDAGARPRPLQSRNTNEKNFKRFQKVPVPGSQGLPNIIGGNDLQAHKRGKNSEHEEWLKEAAEEERQNKREETIGDDLFRYNPKPAKRR